MGKQEILFFNFNTRLFIRTGIECTLRNIASVTLKKNDAKECIRLNNSVFCRSMR